MGRSGGKIYRRLVSVSVGALVAGSALLGVAATQAGAATGPTLHLSTTDTAATCNDTLPRRPWCSGLSGGDVVSLSGANFTAGSTASAVQCNADPSQPVIVFLGQSVPISCSTLNLSTIDGGGNFAADMTLATGTVGPPIDTGVFAETCDPGGQHIPGCTLTGDGTLTEDGQTDAARFPCPPTAAQVTAGISCVVAIGDTDGDRAIGVVLFGDETLPRCPTTTTTVPIACDNSSTTTTSSTSSTSSTSTSSTSSTTTTSEASTTTSSSSTTTTQAATQLTGPYELYCPGTPIGNIVLNGATTSAQISPGNPASGQQFNVTGYQTTVNLPATLAQAAAALGNTSINGSATAKLDVVGATPASKATPTLSFNVAIPSPVPSSGLTLKIPDPATSVGPFSATQSGITVEEDSTATLTLVVSGNNLSLSCTAYPNNSAATGITTSPPSGNPIAPVIAIANGGGGTTNPTTTTSQPGSTTTVNPLISASSSSLAFTGTSSGTKWMAAAGALLVLLGLVLLGVVDAPRRLLFSVASHRPGVTRVRREHSDRPARSISLPRLHLAQRLSEMHIAQRLSDVHPASRVSGSVERSMAASGQAMHSASRGLMRGAQRGARWLLGR